mgnify:CR=1 FL=1
MKTIAVITIVACGAISASTLPSSQAVNPGKKSSDPMGTIEGKVTIAGEPIDTGVLIIASLAKIPDPLPPLSGAKPLAIPFYMTTSRMDGTYSLEVRSSKSSYNMRAFYSVIDGGGPGAGVTVTNKTKSGVKIAAGVKVTDQNFSWP